MRKSSKTLDSLERTSALSLMGQPVDDIEKTRIGVLDGIWFDPSSQQPEFFRIVHGTLFKQCPVVPARFGTIDEGAKLITVPFREEFVKAAPSFAAGAELAETEKQEVTAYFNCDVPVQRKTDLSTIRPEEAGEEVAASNDVEVKQDRDQLEKEEQTFFDQKGFATDPMPSVDVSANLAKTQKQAAVREAEDDARGA